MPVLTFMKEMSQHQDFDEDRILAKFSKGRRKSKKTRGQKESKIQWIRSRVQKLVHLGFNFDNSVEHNITLDELREINKGLREYVFEGTQLTLEDVKEYIYCKMGCKEFEDESKFNNYCIELFNILYNVNTKIAVTDVSYCEECPICFECKGNFVALKCGHIFCVECVESINNKCNDLICPLCRDGSTPELFIDRDNFIKPLPIDELHNLINIVINCKLYHLRSINILDVFVYVARELGYPIDHLRVQVTDRILSSIKFPTEENNLIREYDSRFLSELEDCDPLDFFQKTK